MDREHRASDRGYRPGTDEIAPADAFALLGDGVRTGVLEVLFEAGPPVPFSTIRERVGVRDPGRLNYHLNQLRPHFVARTEAGYRLQRPGYRVGRILRAGFVTDSVDVETVEAGDCVLCDSRVELRYGDGVAVAWCPDCECWFVRFLLAPGGVADRSPAAVCDLLDTRCRSNRRLGNDGVCPLCSGRMDRRLVRDAGAFDHPVHVEYACDRCGCAFCSTVGAAVVEHPAVVSFCYDRGLDTRAPYLWELGFAYDPDRISADRETLEATLTVPLDGDRLAVEVDTRARVRETRIV